MIKYPKPELKSVHVIYTMNVYNYKTTPVKMLETELCTRLLKFKETQIVVEITACPFFGFLKWDST